MLKKISLLLALMILCVPVFCQAEDVEIPQIETDTFEIPDNAAMAFLRDMGAGWNLGNTFDATRDGFPGDDLEIETAWVGVKTTEEMIEAVHQAGFRTMRLPVSWHNHLNPETFEINQPFLDRVQEVADYALSRGMYVILNTHHDVYPEFYYPNSENLEVSSRYMKTIWQQVAARFRDYDEHLIFESMNEPRLKDTSHEWNFSPRNRQCKDALECIMALNQIFVDTVRADGGNNETRYLMVPSYAASPDSALVQTFLLPNDTADNRIIVSVHAYTPYSFALQDGGVTAFSLTSKNQTGEITRFMNNLYKQYIAKGVPVVIGEFGARAKTIGKMETNYQSRVTFAAFYCRNAAARNMPCCWWDNNSFSGNGENFGLLRRAKCSWLYPMITQAIVEAYQ